MVDIKCIAAETDISLLLAENLISLTVIDYDGTKSDELEIVISNTIKRPADEDKIKLWIEGVFYGLFLVDTTETNDLNQLIITATSANFSQSLKTKQNRNFKKTTLHDIIKKIAKVHELKTKLDFPNISYENLVQEKESDLHFLNRLAEKYGAIFSIKNDTIVFVKRGTDLPIFIVDLNKCKPWNIKHISKEKYNSCTATWRETKNNKNKSVTIGSEKPILKITGNYLSDDEAKLVASAKLEEAKRGTLEGSFSKKGEYLSAGSNLLIINSKQDDGEYTLGVVTTTVSFRGFRVEAEIKK
jgi:phage protein D